MAYPLGVLFGKIERDTSLFDKSALARFLEA